MDDSDAAGAESRLGEARELLHGDLVFGWRLEFKLALVTGRLALLTGDAELAASSADELEKRAAALGVPRYVSVARLLRHRAHLRMGLPVDVARVAADLDLLDAAVAVEAWWWTGDVAADLGSPALLDRSAERAARLARNAAGTPGPSPRPRSAGCASGGVWSARREHHHGHRQRRASRHRGNGRAAHAGLVGHIQ